MAGERRPLPVRRCDIHPALAADDVFLYVRNSAAHVLRSIDASGGVSEAMGINRLNTSVERSPATAWPSSQYWRGVNTVSCDIITRFIRENVDYDVYVSLMTPADSRADIPWQGYVLQPGDYISD